MKNPKFLLGDIVYARRANGSLTGPLPVESIEIELTIDGRIDWFFLSECWEDKRNMCFHEDDCFASIEEARANEYEPAGVRDEVEEESDS